MISAAGTFVSTSATRASRNFAIAIGEIAVKELRATGWSRFNGKMPIISFAWLNANHAPRHTPIIHSKN